MRTLLFSLAALCLIASCKKEEEPVEPKFQYCSYKCTVAPMVPTFRTYTSEDIDTVIVKKYTASTSFGQLVSEVMYTLSDTIQYHDPNFNLGIGLKSLELTEGYDYEIQIPATGQVFRISGIIKPDETREYMCGKSYTCRTFISEYSVSGGEYWTEIGLDMTRYLMLRK